MTGPHLSLALHAAVIVAGVAFVTVTAVRVRVLRSPMRRSPGPPRLLIGLALFATAANIGNVVVTGSVPAAVAGALWLLMAAALMWTRWWLHRHLHRRLEARLAASLPRLDGDR